MKVLTQFLTSMKVVRQKDDTYYARVQSVNSGGSIIKLIPFNETVYVSKQVELASGPGQISMQSKTLRGLALGKWNRNVPFWAMLESCFVKKEDKQDVRERERDNQMLL